MKVTIHQPDFIPWMGFFYRWKISDLFIIYDDAQFIKGGWQNRDKIRGSNNDIWVTVPVITKGKRGQAINEVEINNTVKWRHKQLNTFRANFGKSKNFDSVFLKISALYEKDYTKLIDLNLDMIMMIGKTLGITTPVKFSSDFDFKSTRTQRLIDILKSVGSTDYISGMGSLDYLDESLFQKESIKLTYIDQKIMLGEYGHNDDLSYSAIQFLFNR